MSGVRKKSGAATKGKRPAEAQREPDWTSSLKRLYDSVVEEPIPDAFKDLLNKLDSDER